VSFSKVSESAEAIMKMPAPASSIPQRSSKIPDSKIYPKKESIIENNFC